jgi:hypothetical protein
VRQTENQDIPTDSEAIVIIKFSPVSPIQSHPENYLMFRNRISTSKGIRERNISVSDSSVAYIRTKNRFAVMTMDITNNTYVKAIAELSEYDPTNYHTINITNSSCGGSLLATHITEPGIYYLGDVSYSKTVSDIGEEIFNYSVTSTIDEMKSHMRANYPNIPLDDINVKPIEEMFDYTTCGPGQQTIYIYL